MGFSKERQRGESQKGKGMKERRLYEGKLQGKFVEKTRNIIHEFSGKWIRNGFLKKETKGMLFSAQEQVLKTDASKAKIDKQTLSLRC